MSAVARLENPMQPQPFLQADQAGSSAAAPHSLYVGVIDFYRIIRRRLSIVMATIAVVFACAVYVLMTSTPTYTSTATLMVRPIGGDESSPPVSSAATAEAESLRISTMVEMLQSRQLFKKIAKSMNLDKDPEFAPAGEDSSLVGRVIGLVTPKAAPRTLVYERDENSPQKAAQRARMENIVDKLIDQVEVARVGQSHLIDVKATSNEPAKAAQIANRLLSTHVKAQLSDQRERAERRRQILREQIADLRLKTEASDKAVASYKQTHRLFTSKPQEINKDERLQVTGQLAQARAAAVEAATRSRYVPRAPAAIARSAQLDRLRSDESTLANKLAQLSTFYGSGHPDVQNTAAQLESTRSMMQAEQARAASEAAQVAGSAATEARSRAAGEAAAANAGAAALSGQLGSVYARNGQEGLAAVGLRALEREAEVADGQLLAALNELKQLERKGDPKNADAQIVSQASLPLAPSYPQPKRLLGVALAGGLLLGIIVAFATETLDSRIRTAEQVKRLLGVQTLALVPELVAGRPAHQIVHDDPRSHYADAMRNLYIELDVRRPRTDRHIVLVTSPLSKEGKSTIATSLAAAAAAMGKHAIVVDLDLRKGGRVVDATTEPGLDVVAFLSEQAGVDQVIASQDQPSPFTSIRVQQPALDPSALIASPRLELLMEHLSERFQLIVLNAPPILPVRDAKTLARAADQTIMVLRWGQTTPEAARLAMDLFEMPVTGAVLNAVNLRKHASRRYGDAVAYLPQLDTYFSDAPYQAGKLTMTRRLTSVLEGSRARLSA